MAEIVSGVGADSKRTDNNISERVAKIQREAKIQNATGGTYGQGRLNFSCTRCIYKVPAPAMGAASTPAPD
jgi:hypothetical protein